MDAIKRKSWVAYVAFPLFIGLTLVLVLAFRRELLAIFRDREAIRAWIEARKALGPLVFIALQVLQVVIFVIPGEVVQIAGGYAFGFWLGSLYSTLGIGLGSALNFLAGRILGRPFVESLFDRDKIEGIERATATGRGAAGFFLFFAIPGIPKDALCYIAGISRLGFPTFLAISMIGRLPGVLGSSFMGSATYAGSFKTALAVLAAASVLFFVGLFLRERIQERVARLLRKRPRDSEGG